MEIQSKADQSMKWLKFFEKLKVLSNFCSSLVKVTGDLPYGKAAFSSAPNLTTNLKMTIICRVENWVLHLGKVTSLKL